MLPGCSAQAVLCCAGMPGQTYCLAQIVCQRGSQVALLQPDAGHTCWWVDWPQSPEQPPQRIGDARLLPTVCQRLQLQAALLVYVASWAL